MNRSVSDIRFSVQLPRFCSEREFTGSASVVVLLAVAC